MNAIETYVVMQSWELTSSSTAESSPTSSFCSTALQKARLNDKKLPLGMKGVNYLQNSTRQVPVLSIRPVSVLFFQVLLALLCKEYDALLLVRLALEVK